MQNSVQKKKQDKEDDNIEEIIDMVFPDNVVTIGNFKNNHFGCPLTQANLQDNINLLQTKNFSWSLICLFVAARTFFLVL